MEYIDREQAKQAIFDYILNQTISKYPSEKLCKASRMGAEGAMYELDYIPTADVVEVKHGEWVEEFAKLTTVKLTGEDSTIVYRCSRCGRYESQKEPYCNCGAKMDGRKDT